MKLSESLAENAVEVQTRASTKQEALAQLVALVERTDGFADADSLLAEISEREELGSTGIGKSVAIPHVHLENVHEMHVAMMTSSSGIDFDAIDDEPCRIFIMVVAPDSDREQYLTLLAEISRLFRNEDVRSEVLAAQSVPELIEVLRKSETP
ncbi:MAG: PTS sugar transporter subunit IIA [Planctomycetes bacterium]|nr:PTS sugar transporter subunit IIA [Planctomycetota bacterium]